MALTAHKLRIDGMDCPACARKIETALERLPGVSEPSVHYANATLSLKTDDPAMLGTVEGTLRSLGFTAKPVETPSAGAPPERQPRASWWRGEKAMHVLLTAGLFLLAFVLAQLMPERESWIYGTAAVLAVIPFARRAVAGARAGTPFSIETLMSVAAIGAIVIGEAEEAAVVIVLFAVGELLETVATGRARAGIEALIALVPRSALRERNGVTETVPAESLAIGDIVLVRPGDRVASDGTVTEGASEVNEAPVTGESVPVAKGPGASVYAGSINANGALRVEITRTVGDNTIARIIRLVEEAQDAKAPTARMIDRFSQWYTPAAMAAALLVAIVPPLFFGGAWSVWIYRALATLLIACPCALVISTPAAIASGLAVGARRGLLIKGGAALETLGKLKTVAFDKTGTLTEGRPQVTDVVPLAADEATVLARAAAVERGASHPLGIAITAAATARGIAIPAADSAVATPGKAVSARLEGGTAAVGSPRFAAEQAPLPAAVAERIAALESEGKTVVVLLFGGGIDGLIALRDEPRPDAAEGIAMLKARGLSAVMLSGDNGRTAAAIAGTLGLEARAELMPDAKLAEIARLRAVGPIAMIGDGINDAPALAAASIGIAMGGGTDVALETADAALLRNRVTGVAELVDLSRATLGNIWQNIAIALGLKVVFLAATLLGITSLWMAILADTGATVLVTANALRLLAHRSPVEKASRATAASLALGLIAALGLLSAPALAEGGIAVGDAWARATPPGAQVAAGYLTITNDGPAGDRLTGITSPLAARAELHHSTVEDGVMHMAPLPDGIVIAAGETVTLKPGAAHIMFIKPIRRLRAGETVKAILAFEKAGPVEVEFAVRPIGAAPAHGTHGTAP